MIPFSPALAQSAEEDEEDGDWSVILGVGAMMNPEFSGSDSSEIGPVPIVDIEYKDRIFLNTQDGLGVWVLNNDKFYLGTSVGYNFDARDFGDQPEFAGLVNANETIEAKVLAGVEFGPVEVDLEVAQGISGGHDGMHATLSAGLGLPITDKLGVEFGPFVTWGNSNYIQTMYGVTEEEAANSAFAEYTPGSGIERFGAEAQSIYRLTDRLGIGAQVEYSRLVGDAADSPFIETKNQLEVIGGVFFRF
ncbi:MipA/OmpV family protein [Pontixanthobacter sp. CEM42]|uniref:MipA/OmpV family protein n=1 Tax=Pontixanthobacter sp. CEM42 TaxID=2792077 RepID=UPI001ADF60FB|nr:MipA/OmpV family protein [Pontixanthobacter sp. CEM42]